MEHHHEHHNMEHHEQHEEHGAHHDHHAMMIADFKCRFWVSLALSIPVVFLSPMIQDLLGYSLKIPGLSYVLFGLSTAVYFYGGWPFLTGIVDELKKKNPGMMTLIAVAISVAYLYSSAVAFGLSGKMFFWELVTLIAIMLLGHWVEMKSVLGASRSLQLLVNMLPAEAHKLEGDSPKDVPVKSLKKGDVILVKPGEKIPADGTIKEGESYLDESMLTGESKPVKRAKGDDIFGGAVNGNASLHVVVKHTGEESYLNKVISLVKEAQNAKSKTQHLADRAAKWLTYISLSVGFATGVIWLSLGYEPVFALERMVTVMVISCPHALGLAIPLVSAISTSISAQKGLLIRNRTAFENARKITAMVFDKTGTLTKGVFEVSEVQATQKEVNSEMMLGMAAALEQNSEHPIARGIVQKAKDQGLSLPAITHFQSITGKGVEATMEGAQIRVVSPGYLKEKQMEIPEGADGDDSETVVFVLKKESLLGFIKLSDSLRPESEDAIRRFKSQGVKVYMATGDNKKVAAAVSSKLKLDGYYGEVLPDQKVEVIQELKEKGEFVAMTGDGVNDAPALARADIGIAVGSGTDVAAETADIILVNSNPQDILNLINFGKATYRKMIQNLIWSVAYNAFAIPLAAGVLYSTGFVLSPAIGAIFMSLSTVIVAINAQLLKKQLNN